MFACQFALESTMTAILANQGDGDSAERAKASAFGLSLLALAVPLIRRFYDGVIVQCIKLRRKGPFNCKAAALAFTIFLLQLQGAMLKLLSINSSEANMSAAVTSSTAKMLNREATAGAMGASAVVDVASVLAADAYAVFFDGQDAKYVVAVTTIQKACRGKQARARLRHMLGRRLDAAIHIQAHQRGRAARSHVAAFTVVCQAEWVASHERFSQRPGLVWVMRQEAMDVAKGRIERIRRVGPQSWAVPVMRRQSLASESGDLRVDVEVGEECASLAHVDMEMMAPRAERAPPASESHGPSGIVFLQHNSGAGHPFRSGGAESLQRWGRQRRRDVAMAALPTSYPPAHDGDEGAEQTKLGGAQKAQLHMAEVTWRRWVRPALLRFVGHAFVGTQTFPLAETIFEAAKEAKEKDEDVDFDVGAEAEGGNGGGD